jgi:hypothetical protein
MAQPHGFTRDAQEVLAPEFAAMIPWSLSGASTLPNRTAMVEAIAHIATKVTSSHNGCPYGNVHTCSPAQFAPSSLIVDIRSANNRG